MFLKYKHSTFAWDLSLQLTVKLQVKRKRKKGEREKPLKTECVNLVIMEVT